MKGWLSFFAQNKVGWLWMGVLELYGFHLALFIYTCIVTVPFPYQWGYGEGHMLLAAESYRQGEGLYPIHRGVGMTRVTAYPPLFFVVNRWGSRAFRNPFLFGRLLSILATVGLGIGVFLLVRRMTASIGAALVGSMAWFSVSYVRDWAPQMRVDLLALFLSFWGVYWLLVQRQGSLALGAVPFVLALYTKQTMIGGPVAAITYLVATRRERTAWWLGTSVGAGSLILLLLLNAITHGGFYFNVVTCQPQQFDFSSMVQGIFLVLNEGPLFPVMGGLALWGLLQLRSQNREWFATFLAWLGVAGLQVLAYGKTGSDYNYFLELSLVLVVLLGYAAGEAMKPSPPAHRWASLMPLLLLVQLGASLHLPSVPVRALGEANRTVSAIIQRTPGLILSENVSLLLFNHRPVTYSGFELANLVERGIWDQSKVLQDLRAKRYALVVVEYRTLRGLYTDRRYTDEMLRLFRENYREVQHLPPFVLLEPRSPKESS